MEDDSDIEIVLPPSFKKLKRTQSNNEKGTISIDLTLPDSELQNEKMEDDSSNNISRKNQEEIARKRKKKLKSLERIGLLYEILIEQLSFVPDVAQKRFRGRVSKNNVEREKTSVKNTKPSHNLESSQTEKECSFKTLLEFGASIYKKTNPKYYFSIHPAKEDHISKLSQLDYSIAEEQISSGLCPTETLQVDKILSKIKKYNICCENISSETIKRMFTNPGISVFKPYISDQTIQKLLNDPATSIHLVDGDILHVPFSTMESKILQEFLGDESSVQSISVIAESLPGRTVEDIRRYVDGYLNNSIPGHTFGEDQIVVYRRKNNSVSNNIAHFLQKREHGTETQEHNTKKVQSSLFQRFHPVSASTSPCGEVIWCDFNPSYDEYKLVASAAWNSDSPEESNQVILYDLERKKEISLRGHTKTVPFAFFSHCGEYIITCSYDKSLKIWSSSDGQLCKTIDPKSSENIVGHDDEVHIMKLYPDKEKSLIVSADPKCIYLWDIPSGHFVNQLQKRLPSSGTTIDLCFNRSFVIAAFEKGDQGKIKIWNIENTTEDLSMDILHRPTSLAANNNECSFLSATSDGIVSMYDTRTHQRVSKFITHQSDTNDISFSPCNQYLQSSGTDNRSIVFDVRFPSQPVQVLEHKIEKRRSSEAQQGISIAVWSKTGFLFTGGDDATVRIWDVRVGEPLLQTLEGHQASVNALAISSNGDMLASGGDEGRVCLYSWTDVHRLNKQEFSETTNLPQ